MDVIRPMSPSRNRLSLVIDDIPVPSPKKDFNTLLEERLKDVNDTGDDQGHQVKRKFPFLKKGQGLARYRPNPNSIGNRSRARSLPAIPAKSPRIKSPLKPSSRSTKEPPRSRKSEPLRKPTFPAKNSNSKSILNNNNYNSTNQNKIVSVGLSSLKTTKDRLKGQPNLNHSDPEIKTFKELEEVRIFEMMEEKAENSSFCSNSSAVIAFLQQSSPLKNQLFLQRMSSQSRRTDDQEFIHKTNFLAYSTGSPLKANQQHRSNSVEDLAKWENFEKKEQPQLSELQEKVICAVPFGLDVINNEDYLQTVNGNGHLDESAASLHVRFAEFNEYKTIGLSDVSSISTDSRAGDNCSNSQTWSDYSESESSDAEAKVETIFRNGQFNGSTMRKNLVKQFCEQEVDNDVDSYDEDASSSTKLTEEDDGDCSSQTSHDETLMENNQDSEERENNEREDDQILFKSELLKSRLLDLEREIEVFRSETAALKLQRQKVEDERKELQRALKEHKELAQADKARVENYLVEEKKRLAREKAALDSRLKDAREKAQRNKQDRDEIMSLKQQLDQLKEELYQKESKWQAAQARHKSQVRVLMTQNKELKEEVERLEKLKLERQKARKPITAAKDKTRAIHEINRILQTASHPRNKSYSSDEEGLENRDPIVEAPPKPPVYSESSQEQEPQISPFNVERQRNLYKNLLKDASIGIAEYDEAKRNAEEQCKNAMKETMVQQTNKNQEIANEKKKFSEARQALNLSQSADISLNIQKSILKNVKEIKEVDGHIEHWYSNGNVLKIFPDKNLKKLIYYNGDVKESDGTGKIRYFYASSRTWHTTLPDGLEIFEYPDGKIEKRNRNGSTEISYLDGSVRIWEANGLEKWSLPDGTVGETLADGSKVFTFTNGQREVHNKDHKRREYPDGTVKIVYADGTLETRYNNGRVRIKDKDGNLVMDSHRQL